MANTDYKRGIYEANVLVVNLRKEPRTIDYKLGKVYITNRVGQLNIGQRRELYSFVQHDDQVWGRVSQQADAQGTAIWCCISTTNTPNMMKFIGEVEGTETPVPTGLEARVSLLEAQMKVLLAK